jgi:hypothetical protein
VRRFGNRELRRIFGPRREELVGGCRRKQDEELHNFYTSTNIIRIIKPRRMRKAGHAARMGKINAYKILV